MICGDQDPELFARRFVCACATLEAFGLEQIRRNAHAGFYPVLELAARGAVVSFVRFLGCDISVSFSAI